jgi:hypothetical protein
MEVSAEIRGDQILGRYNFPTPVGRIQVSAHTKRPRSPLRRSPRFVTLFNRGVAVKPNLDLTKPIRNEISRGISCVGDRFHFVVKRPLRIYTQESIRKNPLNCARVPSGYRFRPLGFALDNAAFCFLLVASRTLTKHSAKQASNNKGVDFHFAGRWSLQAESLERCTDVFEMNVERAKTIDFRR